MWGKYSELKETIILPQVWQIRRSFLFPLTSSSCNICSNKSGKIFIIKPHWTRSYLLVGQRTSKLGVVRTFLPNSLLLLQYLCKTVRNQSWCKKPHWNRETLSHDCTNSLLFNFRAQQLRRSLHVAIHVGTKKLFPHQRLHQSFTSVTFVQNDQREVLLK